MTSSTRSPGLQVWTANGFLDDEEPFDPGAITPQAAQPRRRTALVACLAVSVFAVGAWSMQKTREMSPESAWELTANELESPESRRLGLLRIRATVLKSVDTLREIAEGDDRRLAAVARQTINELRNSLCD